MKRDKHAEVVQAHRKRSARYRRVFDATVRRIDLALLVLEMRAAAGLSQEELAKRARTTQSVIARLEDAEYKGQSLRMLERIAAACGVGLKLHAEKQPAWDREVVLV